MNMCLFLLTLITNTPVIGGSYCQDKFLLASLIQFYHPRTSGQMLCTRKILNKQATHHTKSFRGPPHTLKLHHYTFPSPPLSISNHQSDLQLHTLPQPSNFPQNSFLLLVASLSTHEQDPVSSDCNVTRAWIVRGSPQESKLGAFRWPSALTGPRFCTTKAHVSLKLMFLKFSLPSVLIRFRAVFFSWQVPSS